MRAEKRDKLTCVICRGFNKFFDVPKVDGKTPATFRTAFAIKMRDFDDEWGLYDALFWRIIHRITIDLNASIRILCPESETGEMQSLEELRIWQKEQAASDSEFGIDVPTEIRFLKGGSLLCLMSLEDWSDIGKPEPYSLSYTFSFYSYEKEIDESVNGSIASQLSIEKEAGEIKAFQECNSPKWYWPLLDIIKGDSFFICAGFSILALFAIVMIIVSPSPSTYNKMEQSRHFLKKVRKNNGQAIY